MHALWTLDGMKALSSEIKKEALADRSPILRRAMIQMIESQLPQEIDLLLPLERNGTPVAEQLVFTLGTIDHPKAEKTIQTLASNHLADQGVMLATAVSLWGKRDLPFVKEVKSKKAFEKISKRSKGAVSMAWDRILSSWDRGMNFAKDFDTTQKK